ncbi:TRAP-type transport system, small permease component, predicted N-acetylneuraminate transporter [Marinobacterium lacunae]|uniref:TRAP transporter small permease protein n=1 Tax=Marinobacterium lacunae TaxID=1232683 RepID=A0A081G046_9GAMM|nr:TRAP transporter small permease [Marinobacterium lacunae]KEA64151.1 TRAP-type transport system, small permease component, predicted N-acetylneuraminate transporter [Marinobacterium lacunae]
MSSRPPKARPERTLAALALTVICLISLGNVVVRYATDASFAFTEEFSVFLLVIVTFAGAAAAARDNQHIRIELIEHMLPARFLPVLYILQWAAGVAVLGAACWYGYTFAMEEYEWESLSPGLGLPNWIYVAWLPLLSAAILVRMTQNLIDRLTGRDRAEGEQHDA